MCVVVCYNIQRKRKKKQKQQEGNMEMEQEHESKRVEHRPQPTDTDIARRSQQRAEHGLFEVIHQKFQDCSYAFLNCWCHQNAWQRSGIGRTLNTAASDLQGF